MRGHLFSIIDFSHGCECITKFIFSWWGLLEELQHQSNKKIDFENKKKHEKLKLLEESDINCNMMEDFQDEMILTPAAIMCATTNLKNLKSGSQKMFMKLKTKIKLIREIL